ncbi:MAG: class I SAM-dependent methyltransferase [Bdellovibrionota bacterium]
MKDKHQSNRQAWNEAASTYRKTLDESIAFLKNGGKNFCPPEMKFLKNLNEWCDRAIHLQCAGGHDSLSLINLGAKEVIGVDISDEMINIAKEKSQALGMNAKWYQSDVLETPADLNGTADLVYTGRGALNWNMDIKAWAKVVARLLKPQGRAYIFEGHPITYFFDMKASELSFDPEFEGYFSGKILSSNDWPETYVGKIKEDIKQQSTKYETAWPTSSVINALIEAGLTLQRFEEHPDAYWEEFPNLAESKRRMFPNTYSILATKT